MAPPKVSAQGLLRWRGGGWFSSLPGERWVTGWRGLLLINRICPPDLSGDPLVALGADPGAQAFPPLRILMHPPRAAAGAGYRLSPPKPVLVPPNDRPHSHSPPHPPLSPCPFPTSFYLYCSQPGGCCPSGRWGGDAGAALAPHPLAAKPAVLGGPCQSSTHPQVGTSTTGVRVPPAPGPRWAPSLSQLFQAGAM